MKYLLFYKSYFSIKKKEGKSTVYLQLIRLCLKIRHFLKIMLLITENEMGFCFFLQVLKQADLIWIFKWDMKQIRIIMCAAIVLFSAEILPVEYDEGYLLETPESYYGRIEYLPTLKKINYIRGAVTDTGLQVKAFLIDHVFEKQKKVSPEERASLHLQRRPICPTWNYIIKPRTCSGWYSTVKVLTYFWLVTNWATAVANLCLPCQPAPVTD